MCVYNGYTSVTMDARREQQQQTSLLSLVCLWDALTLASAISDTRTLLCS